MRVFRSLLAACALLALTAVSAQTPQPAPAATPAAVPVTVPDAPRPQGKAWILIDHASGDVLAGENIDQPLPPASITKVMTSYVVAAEIAAGRVDPKAMLRVSENAWRSGGAGTDGSYSALAIGSEVALDDVLHGLVIQSGNDAAIVLAEHIAGSEAAFAELMNQYAQRLGMRNSRFVNAHGLTAEGHYMSARDIAILSSALIRDFPEHYALYKLKEYTYNRIQQWNRNGLLWKDASVDGIKTGHTAAAGYCLAASAQRGEQRLVSVVLGIDTNKRGEGFRAREEGNQVLLEWGFRHFETHKLYDAAVAVAEPKLWRGDVETLALGLAQPLLITVPRGRYAELQPAMDLPKQLAAPIAKDQVIGTLRISLDGKVLAERPLLALAEAPEGGFFKRLSDDFWLWWESE